MESMRDINRVMEREIAKGVQSLEAGTYRVWRIFVSGDNIKGKIAGGAILFAENR